MGSIRCHWATASAPGTFQVGYRPCCGVLPPAACTTRWRSCYPGQCNRISHPKHVVLPPSEQCSTPSAMHVPLGAVLCVCPTGRLCLLQLRVWVLRQRTQTHQEWLRGRHHTALGSHWTQSTPRHPRKHRRFRRCVCRGLGMHLRAIPSADPPSESQHTPYTPNLNTQARVTDKPSFHTPGVLPVQLPPLFKSWWSQNK